MNSNKDKVISELRKILPSDLKDSVNTLEEALSDVNSKNMITIRKYFEILNWVMHGETAYLEIYEKFYENSMKPLYRQYGNEYLTKVEETYSKLKIINFKNSLGRRNNVILEKEVFISIEDLIVGEQMTFNYLDEDNEWNFIITTNVNNIVVKEEKKELIVETKNSTYVFCYSEELYDKILGKFQLKKDIIFEDKEFENCIRKSLNKPEGMLYSEDLLEIKGIAISNQDITEISIPWQSDASAFNMNFPNLIFNINNSCNGLWLRDLGAFKHIKALHIYVDTEELSFLSDFVELKKLYIIKTNNTDWSFIENLERLEYICVQDSKFDDLRVINRLCSKQKAANEVVKSTFGEQHYFYTGLEHLFLVNCDIYELEPLRTCESLMDVNLSRNRITDIEPLKDISSLYYLTLRYNDIENISSFASMKGLYCLNLRHNKIRDISVFYNKQGNLSRLFLGDNPIDNYEPLKGWYFVVSDVEDYTNSNENYEENEEE